MIFRNSRGEYKIFTKYDCKNDKIYYTRIMELQREISKEEKRFPIEGKKLKGKDIFQNTNK